MDSIKELLKSFLINDQISSNYNISFLVELIDKVKSNPDYYYEFILSLDDNFINELINKYIDKDKQKTFIASTIYLKNLILVNKEQDVKIPLSKPQEDLLGDIFSLINKEVEDYENNKEEKEDIDKNNQRIKDLINKFDSNEILIKDDYDLVEDLLSSNEKLFNDLIEYFNDYNSTFIKKEEPIKEEVKEEPIKEEIVTNIDIFNPHFFNKNEALGQEENVNVYDLLLDLDIKKDNLDEYSVSIIDSYLDIDRFLKNYKYFKNNLYKEFNKVNIRGLITVLFLSDVKSIKETVTNIKKNNLSLEDIFNRCSRVFLPDKVENFKKNIELIKNYTEDLNNLVKENITFFFNTYEYNKNKIDSLINKGLDISKLISTKPKLLAINNSTLLNNMDVLTNYNYDLNDIDYDSISIIGVSNLNIIIDFLIESNFSEYLFIDETTKKTRSLIIKRLFYAYKNDLNIWDEDIKGNRINPEYDKYILKERKSLSEEEIYSLIESNDLLEMLEEGKRLSLYSDTKESRIKRKYEFIFGKKVISRLKTYSIINVLLKHNVELKEAIFYALTYNLNVDNNIYLGIKKEIMGK